MKTRSVLFSLAALSTLVVAGSAAAQAPSPKPSPQLGPALGRPEISKFVQTRVTGTIRTNGIVPGETALNGYNCDDLVVIVSSKEYNPAPPGTFSSPKWVRTKPAAGTWSSGQCTYSVPVVPNAEFNVYVSAGVKEYPCHFITNLVVSPGYSPWLKASFGQTVTSDFSMSSTGNKFYCGILH